jgi:hypothetical protein
LHLKIIDGFFLTFVDFILKKVITFVWKKMRCRFVLIPNFLGAELSFSTVPKCLFQRVPNCLVSVLCKIVACSFYFGHCIVYLSSIYAFWLPLWYLHTLYMDSEMITVIIFTFALTPVFCGVNVAQFLVVCVVFCRPVFVILSFVLCPFSIYIWWLHPWYLQTYLTRKETLWQKRWFQFSHCEFPIYM